MNEADFNKANIEIPFHLKDSQKLMYIPIGGNKIDDQEIKGKVVSEIHHTYGKKLGLNDFELTFKVDGADHYNQLTAKDRVQVTLSYGIELIGPPSDKAK